MTTHPEHDEEREALKLEFHHLTWALRHREITPEKAMERIADFILTHTTKAVEVAEVLLRHKIASQAPDCTHSLSSEKEHKAWCGFANSIWTHWAVKNGAGIVNGKPYRATPTLKALNTLFGRKGEKDRE